MTEWLPPRPPERRGAARAEEPAPLAVGADAEAWVCDLCERRLTGYAEADRHARTEHTDIPPIKALGALRRPAPPASGGRGAATAADRLDSRQFGVIALTSLVAAVCAVGIGYQLDIGGTLPKIGAPERNCARYGGRYRDGFCEGAGRSPIRPSRPAPAAQRGGA